MDDRPMVMQSPAPHSERHWWGAKLPIVAKPADPAAMGASAVAGYPAFHSAPPIITKVYTKAEAIVGVSSIENS